MNPDTKPTGLVKVMQFFGFGPDKDEAENVTAFKSQWARLAERDKFQLKRGVNNGSLTY